MDLENINRVETIKSVEILNPYLEKGRILISTEKRVSGYSGAIDEKVYFIIDWDKDKNPIYPKYKNEEELFRAENPHWYENAI